MSASEDRSWEGERALPPTLVGCSPAFLRAIELLPAMAASDATIMIVGETGTGKELVARAIHALSERCRLPFTSVNCGALPETLLENELFGHERGAFTDAREARPGLVAHAGGGTLFLDEVDALTSKAQVALLRLIEDRTFRALGSQREERSNARFVSATNAPLRRLLETGGFRADLYYRLCVLTITLPALRDRRDDIPLLAAHFLAKHCQARRLPPTLTPDAQAALMSHTWPGNLRELENTIRRILLISRSSVIDTQDLELPPVGDGRGENNEPQGTSHFRVMKTRAIEAFERDYLTTLMREHRGNISQAARAAGKERRDLGRLLKKHNIVVGCRPGAVPQDQAGRPLPGDRAPTPAVRPVTPSKGMQ